VPKSLFRYCCHLVSRAWTSWSAVAHAQHANESRYPGPQPGVRSSRPGSGLAGTWVFRVDRRHGRARVAQQCWIRHRLTVRNEVDVDSPGRPLDRPRNAPRRAPFPPTAHFRSHPQCPQRSDPEIRPESGLIVRGAGSRSRNPPKSGCWGTYRPVRASRRDLYAGQGLLRAVEITNSRSAPLYRIAADWLSALLV
jgi:hypothetical protein